MRPTVLIVDDHEDFRASARALLELQGFEVAERLASSAQPPRVVLISSRRRSAYELRLPGAPVAGFLGKHELSGAALAALL